MKKVKLYFSGISLVLLAGYSVSAQSPGGIPVDAWYKSDAISTLFSDAGTTTASDNASIYQWNDFSGSGYDLLQAGSSSRPVFSDETTLANFNPTVTFDGSNDWMQFTAPTGVNVIDRASGTIFVAGQMNVQKRSGFAGFHASMDYPGLHVFNGDYKMLFFTGGPGYQGLSMDPMTATTYFTAGTGWQNEEGTTASYAAATVSLNGNRVEYSDDELYNANLSAGARDFRIGADNNWGAFSGQLNEILVFEDRLTPAQMDQVETYLAIKYGTTYANGTENYVNSSGATVWDAAAHTGFHYNIAGIARDDDGSLYQKQSWSSNLGNQVLIGLGDLANTNAANSGTLDDGQYLIWGDNGLAKVPTVTTSDFTGISHHFEAIWKVQNNGSVGTVRVAWPKSFSNLTLIQSADELIEAMDVTTDMSANEITINGVVYNYADVSLANGTYFTFGAKLAAPGGVMGDLRVWLKSDNGFTPSVWADMSGLGNDYTQTNTNRQPFTATQHYNFNPIVDFGTTGTDSRFMAIPSGKPYSADGTNSTIFVASLNRSTPTYSDIIGFGGTTTTASLTQANSPVFITYGSRLRLYPYSASTTSIIPALKINNLYLNDVSFTVGTSGINYGQNGITQTISSTVTASNAKHASGSILGSQPEARNGLIGEVIAYERDLTEAEKQRIRTYIAIKYGITLPHNYIASDETIVWSQTANAGYNTNIAGIANDGTSALEQKQSNSINEGQQVLIGLTGLANTNAENTGTMAEGQFLIWGDNGGAKSLSVGFNYAAITDLNLRFGAVWKVQNTGSVATVRVAWPAGIPNIHLIRSTDEVIDDTDTRTDMSANVITVNGVTYNYADVTLADGSYFTFAGYIVGPGGVASAAWYRSDAAGQQFSDAGTTVATDGQPIYQWNEYKGTGYDLLQASAGDRPVFSNTTTLANFNPTVTFNGSQWMRYAVSGTTNIIDREDGTIYASGYLNQLSNVDVAGFGETTLDYPGLHTHTTGGNLKTLFYAASSGGSYPGLSDNNLVNKNYFTMGGAWENGAGGTSAHLAATVSQNGIHTEYTGSEIPNITQAGNDVSAIYRAFRIGEGNHGPLYGQLNEVVVFEQRLSEDEMNRVESYMSIKYGTTYAEGTKDYVNSSSNVVWTAIDNDGYHYNIAGIARDDEGSLYQKQSWSTNPGAQVLISTTGLANTNAGNTAVLSNNQFLIWGDNNLAKAPTVVMSGITDVNYRFASIWKVQNTNSVGTVRVAWKSGYANLKLIQSTDDDITSSDIVTDMSGTQVINGAEYAYADVTLSNGQYFTFAAFLQAPGGITNGLSHWYRADKMTESSGDSTDLTSWTDFTSGVVSSQINPIVDLPKYVEGNAYLFNFNPGINFTDGNQMIGNISEQTLTSLNFDIFSLTKEGVSGSRFFNIGRDNTTFGGTNWDQPGLMANGSIHRRNNTGGGLSFLTPGGAFPSNSPSITYYTFTDISASKGINGASIATPSTHSSIGAVTGGHIFGANSNSGSSAPNGDDAGFTGFIGELIIYGHDTITAAERNKVDAYLAIKYGVTLDTNVSYVTSQDDTVWNRIANIDYYNNVAGIGNDFISALHQKQSRSQHANSNSQVIIGLGDIAETNAENTNGLQDGQFLVWGDNGRTDDLSDAFVAFEYAGSTDNGRRMTRVWKVQNTDVDQQVLIRFPQSSVGTTTLPDETCADYVILFAPDTTFTTGLTVSPLTINDTFYDALHTFPEGMSYFTYARIRPLNPGIVYLPASTEVTTQYDDECNTGEWTYYHLEGDATQKIIAMAGFPTVDLDSFGINITPEGAVYDDGVQTTRLMPRITSVADSNVSAVPSGKVRIYYSQEELDATLVSGALTSGWFKYSGTAEDVITDIYSDGVFDTLKAVSLIPDAYGIEDGVNYVEFYNVDSFSSFVYLSSTFNEGTVLDVSWLYFTAQARNKEALLTWGTASETGNNGFDIERSSDGRNWSSIGFIATLAENGNSNAPLNYVYTDHTPLNGDNFYRLKQVNLDGRYEYSEVRMVRFGQQGHLTVVPNPTSGIVTISGFDKGNNQIVLVNALGQVLLNTNLKDQSEYRLDLSRFTAGVYYISVRNEDGTVSHHKVVKQ